MSLLQHRMVFGLFCGVSVVFSAQVVYAHHGGGGNNDDLVKISGLEDVVMDVPIGINSNMTDVQGVCVFNNDSDKYRVRATSANGMFKVLNGSENIPYLVHFKGSQGNWKKLDYGQFKNNVKKANENYVNCGGSDNANVRIKFKKQDLQQAVGGGTYHDTLYLMVEPD
ncbi:MAG: hypothetical protein OXR68_03650 [Alphaproteobacteria bacterium]|nr:hypothetical protein [Alphaproteobacteria bacterium]MDD9919701.1 hypothetical protein [Alphaproteobacteria bacterium]